MLQYSQCRIDAGKDSFAALTKKVASLIRVPEEKLSHVTIIKKSIDARKKPDIYYNYTVAFDVEDEKRVLRQNRKNKNLTVYIPEPDLSELIRAYGTATEGERICIVGSGPAGLMCGYFLALCNRRPVIIERGAPMWERVDKVARFWREGTLDPETNVSFGEGGAGTFSDGKLNTGVKDKTGKKKFILETFVEHGAPEEILYLAKPHIGTDELRGVIQSMRETIEELGGTYYFHTRFTGFETEDERGGDRKRLRGILARDEEGRELRIPCDRCVLAIGHSARDTFQLLKEAGIAMEQKPFAVGVRVEHPQSVIDRIQYGLPAPVEKLGSSGTGGSERTVDSEGTGGSERTVGSFGTLPPAENLGSFGTLPPADYKLTGKTEDGRGVYSFCMCPGGYVVNASTEAGMTVINGMSDHARDSGAANSAVVVTVGPEDFGSDDVLAGIEFQRELERHAFAAGQGKIPVQRFGDFVAGQVSDVSRIRPPRTKGNFVGADVKKLLPSYIAGGIIEGMRQFGKKMNGFDDDDALIFGTETRTSSPVRIIRNSDFESDRLAGLYPCGEGAGYAGGIMSAAMDGLRIAIQIVSERNREEHEE